MSNSSALLALQSLRNARQVDIGAFAVRFDRLAQRTIDAVENPAGTYKDVRFGPDLK